MLRFYNKKKLRLSTVLLISNMLIFLVSAAYLGNYYYQGEKNRTKQGNLTDILDNMGDDSSSDGTGESGEPVDRYASIRDDYPNLVGRVIFYYYNDEKNLPIMQTVDDPEYYLYRDLDGEDSNWGTPFVDYRCDLSKPSTNFIIYGHNMKDLSQFGSLSTYNSKDYWEKYPTIKFETMYESQKTYEIVAAFYARIYSKTETDAFKYYNFINAENEEDFNNFITNIKEMACYDTGITPVFGEQLITLSTCDYSKWKDGSGRFVIVARKTSE